MKKLTPAGKKTQEAGRLCPRCGFPDNRPHAAICVRCSGELPGGTGCTGCGACRSGV